MLKIYGEISRFMDGPAVNVGTAFVYLKDADEKERIGTIHTSNLKVTRPFLEFRDINSRERLRFDGESHTFAYNVPFVWFPQIQEVGILYHDFDNDIQRWGIMSHDFHKFVLNELYLEIAKKHGAPVGETDRYRMEHNLRFPAVAYQNSFEYLYATIVGNRDVLLISHPPIEVRGNIVPYTRKLSDMSEREVSDLRLLARRMSASPPKEEPLYLAVTLNKFLEKNTSLKQRLVAYPVGEHGRYYKTPEKVIARIKDAVPDDVLEVMYHQFKAELSGRLIVERLRADNPREKLEAKVKKLAG